MALFGRLLSGLCLFIAAAMIVMTLIIGAAPFGEFSFGSRDGSFETFTYELSKTLALNEVDGPVSPSHENAETVWTTMHASQVPPGSRLALFAAVAVPVAFMVWGLWSAGRCFRGLARGAYFASDTIYGLRNFALGVVLYMVSSPIIDFLLGPFLPSAGKGLTLRLNIDVSGDALLLFIFAAAVALVSNALARAAEIAAENEQFI